MKCNYEAWSIYPSSGRPSWCFAIGDKQSCLNWVKENGLENQEYRVVKEDEIIKDDDNFLYFK